MTDPNATNSTTNDVNTIDRGAGRADSTFLGRRRWVVWGSALAIVVIASLWYGISRSSGPTFNATVADCSESYVNPTTGQPSTDIRPVVVGLGSVAAVAVLQTPVGVAWCFDGMGTGGAGISHAAMHSTLAALGAVEDGNLPSDVLIIVHLGHKTTSVSVTTADSRSTVLAHGGGFEVLRLSTANWPHWHAPWSRRPVPLGSILGFDSQGRVTSNLPFSWCPGGINQLLGTSC